MGFNFQLLKYAERYNEVSLHRFGRVFDYEAVERHCLPLRRGDRAICPEDIHLIFSAEKTPFSIYWPLRNRNRISGGLGEPLFLGRPPIEKRSLVDRMFSLVGSMGAASVILRFVHPMEFGVMSTPVMDFLRVSRPTQQTLFVAYCEELRIWQSHFDMSSVAQTEMGLWAFYELEKAGRITEHERLAFETDLFVHRRRMTQVVDPTFGMCEGLERAQLFSESDPNLAGQIASREYERLLRKAARRFTPQIDTNQDGWAIDVIQLLRRKGKITFEQEEKLREIWGYRNRAVHPGEDLLAAEAETMIQSIVDICLPWDPSTRFSH